MTHQIPLVFTGEVHGYPAPLPTVCKAESTLYVPRVDGVSKLGGVIRVVYIEGNSGNEVDGIFTNIETYIATEDSNRMGAMKRSGCYGSATPAPVTTAVASVAQVGVAPAPTAAQVDAAQAPNAVAVNPPAAGPNWSAAIPAPARSLATDPAPAAAPLPALNAAAQAANAAAENAAAALAAGAPV